MPKTKIKFTYKDYKSLPESETKRYELLEGELIMVSSAGTRHQSVSRNLGSILWRFARDNSLGAIYNAPLDVILCEDIAQPAIICIPKQHSQIITEEEVHGAPGLVTEITSPFTAERDRTYKGTLCARHGIPEYWIVDPRGQTIEVIRLGEIGFQTTGIYKEVDCFKLPNVSRISYQTLGDF